MKHRRTHDVTPFDNLDRAVLFLAFLIGAGGSLALKAMDVHPFIPAAFAAITLCCYALVAWAGGRLKVEPETVGDNCYYLGFLFTLASLAYTLYQVAGPSGSGGRPVDITSVISGFGLALSSTIVGVFLRVFFMQLRSDFVAKDREMKAEVNRAFGDFKKSMSGMLLQMKSYAVESVQSASERDERIRRSTEQFLEDHQTAAKQVLSAINESQETHQKQMKEVIDNLQALQGRLREQEMQAIEQIQNRRKLLVSDLEQTEKIFAAQIESVNEVTSKTTAMLSQIEEYTAKSAHLASDNDERRREAAEQFIEQNRKLLKENTDFLLDHMAKASSEAAKQAAQEFSAALNNDFALRRIGSAEECAERVQEHDIEVSEQHLDPSRGAAVESNDRKGRMSRREELIGASNDAGPLTDEQALESSERRPLN